MTVQGKTPAGSRRPARDGSAAPVDPSPLLAAFSGRLAEGGQDALPGALALLVAGLGVRSAVLRDAADGEVLAVAGDVVHAVTHDRPAGPGSVVEVPVQVGGRSLAALTVIDARPSHLPVLRAAAAALALAVRRSPHRLPLALLDAADAAVDAAADALHDGPVQELVVARYAADAAVRGGDATTVRDAVQCSLVSLRRALWLLRPRGAAEGLAAALAQLSVRLQEAGRPGLLLDLDDDASARLPPQAASVCYRLVQGVAGRPGGPATAVRLSSTRLTVRLEVDGDPAGVPGPASTGWSAHARALGADLHLPEPATGRFALSIPVLPRTDPAPTS